MTRYLSPCHDAVKDGFRKEIARRSVQVLRSRGLGDAEVKAEIEELLDAERGK